MLPWTKKEFDPFSISLLPLIQLWLFVKLIDAFFFVASFFWSVRQIDNILRFYADTSSQAILVVCMRTKTFWSIVWAIQNIVVCYAVVRSWPHTDHPLIGHLKIESNENQSLIFESISNLLILTCSFLFALREINIFIIRTTGKLAKCVVIFELAIVLVLLFVVVLVGFRFFKLLFLISLSTLYMIQLIFTIINIAKGTLLLEEFLLTDCFRFVPIVFVWLFRFGIFSPGPVITILIAHDILFAVVNLFQHFAINSRIFTVIN